MNYRECEITKSKLPNGANGVEWSHENYDGSDNLLCGWAYNEEQAMRQIDELHNSDILNW